jgi:hypothetical protein
MKENYFDLTLQEFLDVLTNKKKFSPNINLSELVENSDKYSLSGLYESEIYNYLDKVTHGFDIERVKIILHDIDVYYEADFLERIRAESMKKHLENGWEIPYIEIDLTQGEKMQIPDDEKMFCRTHIAAHTFIEMAVDILKKKLPKTKTEEIQKTFSRSFSTDEQKKLFDGLIKDGFLPKETNFSHFCHVFGSITIPDNEKPFEPLKWQKNIGLLAYLIDNLFSDTDNQLWEITSRCFTWKNNTPNKDSMKNTVSKYKNNFQAKPKGFETLDTILSL